MTWKQHFIKFLKDNNMYESYMFNFNKDFKYRQNFNLRNNGVKAFFEKISHKDYILRAFTWYESLGGAGVWELLHRKWHIYIYNIEKELNEQQ